MQPIGEFRNGFVSICKSVYRSGRRKGRYKVIKRGEKKLWNKWKHNSKRREEKGQKLEKRKKKQIKDDRREHDANGRNVEETIRNKDKKKL